MVSKFLFYCQSLATAHPCSLPGPRCLQNYALWSLFSPLTHLPGQPLSPQAHTPHLPMPGYSHHIQTVLPSLSLSRILLLTQSSPLSF